MLDIEAPNNPQLAWQLGDNSTDNHERGILSRAMLIDLPLYV